MLIVNWRLACFQSNKLLDSQLFCRESFIINDCVELVHIFHQGFQGVQVRVKVVERPIYAKSQGCSRLIPGFELGWELVDTLVLDGADVGNGAEIAYSLVRGSGIKGGQRAFVLGRYARSGLKEGGLDFAQAAKLL